ncbi:hypothetical protein JCM21900_004310 [Sporobolomyces salmonicolor]
MSTSPASRRPIPAEKSPIHAIGRGGAFGVDSDGMAGQSHKASTAWQPWSGGRSASTASSQMQPQTEVAVVNDDHHERSKYQVNSARAGVDRSVAQNPSSAVPPSSTSTSIHAPRPIHSTSKALPPHMATPTFASSGRSDSPIASASYGNFSVPAPSPPASSSSRTVRADLSPASIHAPSTMPPNHNNAGRSYKLGISADGVRPISTSADGSSQLAAKHIFATPPPAREYLEDDASLALGGRGMRSDRMDATDERSQRVRQARSSALLNGARERVTGSVASHASDSRWAPGGRRTTTHTAARSPSQPAASSSSRPPPASGSISISVHASSPPVPQPPTTAQEPASVSVAPPAATAKSAAPPAFTSLPSPVLAPAARVSPPSDVVSAVDLPKLGREEEPREIEKDRQNAASKAKEVDKLAEKASNFPFADDLEPNLDARSGQFTPRPAPAPSTSPSPAATHGAPSAPVSGTAVKPPTRSLTPRSLLPDRNRVTTGGARKDKKTAEELEALMAAMKLKNDEARRKQAKAEEDRKAFEAVAEAERKRSEELERLVREEKERIAREGRERRERTEELQKLINAERDAAAARKLAHIEGRAWDAEKLSRDGEGGAGRELQYPSMEARARREREEEREREEGEKMSEEERRRRDGVRNEEALWETVEHREGPGRAQLVVHASAGGP